MALLIDPPLWPAHGRLWSHLVSDLSFAELHAFARANGIPPRGFDGDHYDVPQGRYAALVVAGAEPVAGRELLRRLRAAGLRRPKRRGERVLAGWPGADGVRVDVLRSALPPLGPVRGVWALVGGPAGVLAVPDASPGGWALPHAATGAGCALTGPGPLAAAALAAAAVAPWLPSPAASSGRGQPGPAGDGSEDAGQGWRQVGYLRRGGPPGADVELVLHRLDVPGADGVPARVRPPARWVPPEVAGRSVPGLAPLLDAVLAAPPSDTVLAAPLSDGAGRPPAAG